MNPWHRLSHRFFRALPLLVVIIGLGTTYGVWVAANKSAKQAIQEEFDFRTKEILARIESRLGDYEEVLQGTAGLFAASEAVDRNEFRSYVETLQLAQRHPGVQGVGFALALSPQEKASHTEQVRKEGFPDYTIRPEGARQTYTSIVYLEPLSWRNRRAFGYDMYSEPVRREAMERARDQGTSAMSGKVTLVQETDTDVQAGFLMYVPIYRNGTPHNTLAERRRNLIGWVYAPFRIKDLMAGVLGRYHGDEGDALDLHIYDGRPGPESLMYDADEDLHAKNPPTPAFHTEKHLTLAGHDWTSVIRSRPAFDAKLGAKGRELAVEGITGTLLATLIAWLLANGRARAFKRAEEMNRDLAKSEGRHRQLFEQATVAIALADMKTGEILDLNQAMEELVGWRRNELLGRPQTVLHPGPEIEGVSSSFARHRSDADGELIESQVVTRDGRIRDVSIKASVVELDGRKALLAFFKDITERKRAEEELLAQRRFMRQVIDTDPNRIFVKDAQGKFLLVNQAMAAAHGMTPEEMIGRANAQVNPHGGEVERYLKLDRDVIENRREHVSIEVSSLGRDQRWFLSIKRPMEQPDGTVNVLGIAIDITDRKQAEEKLGEAYDKLRLMSGYLETIREEEQKRIARELHDEMGGVLAALNMSAARLEARLPSEWRDDMASMAKLVSRGIQAMRQTVSRLRPSLLDDMGFIPAIEHYIQEFQQSTGIECQLINSLGEEELELEGHRPATLFRILQESLTNVAKHAEATKTTIVLKEYRGSLVLSVRDNGKGFDRHAQKGHSFGLLGIRERALIVGGKVKITSKPDKGTTVWIAVPMAPPHQSPASAIARSILAQPRTPPTVGQADR